MCLIGRSVGGGAVPATIYTGDNLVGNLGLHLRGGRDFDAGEREQLLSNAGFGRSGMVVLSRHLANRLFLRGDALGSLVYAGGGEQGAGRKVVGIVDNPMSNDLTPGAEGTLSDAMIFPGVLGNWPLPIYLFRIDRGTDAGKICRTVLALLHRGDQNELADSAEPCCESLSDLRERALGGRHATVYLLAVISAMVLLVAVLGVAGLSAYRIQLCACQVDVRRALGANRGDIVRMFCGENLLIAGFGSLLGVLLTVCGGGLDCPPVQPGAGALVLPATDGADDAAGLPVGFAATCIQGR